MIEILPGGIRCSIRGAEMKCADAVAYLRDVLELEPGHAVRISAAPSVAYEPIRALLAGSVADDSISAERPQALLA